MPVKVRVPKRRSPAAEARLPEGFTERIANVDGVTISYKVGGQGPAVVRLRGLRADGSHVETADPVVAF